MTDFETPDAVLRLAGELPDMGDRTFGYLAPPSLVVAMMAWCHGACESAEDLKASVARLGGAPELDRITTGLDRWFSRAVGRRSHTAEFHDDPYGVAPALLHDVRVQNNHVVIPRAGVVYGSPSFSLSAELPGIRHPHESHPSNWRDRLAARLSERAAAIGIEAPTADRLSMGKEGYGRSLTIARGAESHESLLAPEWRVNHVHYEHAPDAVLDAAARDILAVLEKLRREERGIREVVALGEAGLERKLAKELGPTDLPAPRVHGTRIVRAHLSLTPHLHVTHFNVEADVTMPDDLFEPVTQTTTANFAHFLDYGDVRAFELRMRARGEAWRAGGVRVDTILRRCMERDGVGLDAIKTNLRMDKPVTPRRLGFGPDVRKISVRSGVISAHVNLGGGVIVRNGRIHVTSTTMPDIVTEALVGRQATDLADHPLLAGAVITRVVNARTGSLIAQTDMDLAA